MEELNSGDIPNIYFMEGLDPRTLSTTQQQEILNFVKKDPLGQSFYVYNEQEAERRIQKWKKTLPWIQIRYPVKVNNYQEFLKNLINTNIGFDCASKNEIETMLNLGADRTKIVYSNAFKEDRELKWAGEQGVQLTIADSIDELKKIQILAPKMKILWRIAIKQYKKDKLSSSFSAKFGDETEEQEDIQKRMKQIADLGITLKGVHFHCGSGHKGSSAFSNGVKKAHLFLEIGKKHGHQMNILDIGGGFPIGEIPQSVIEALKPLCNNPLGYKTIAEPGRYVCAQSFYVVMRVIGKNLRKGKMCYYVNDSIYYSFPIVASDNVNYSNQPNQFYARIIKDNNKSKDQFQKHQSVLFGMTCDGADIICENLLAPVDLSIGDWICVGGMGAYSLCLKTNFNGMKIQEKVVNWKAKIQQVQINPQIPDI